MMMLIKNDVDKRNDNSIGTVDASFISPENIL
jgi:hypothetical protein